MCGRYSLTSNLGELGERFDFEASDLIHNPRYNIAPTQQILTVTHNGSRNEASLMKWGLIPPWSKTPDISSRMINARGETLEEKPSFREPLFKRRCLVLADGFYEWTKTNAGKRPMRIKLRSGEPFGFAGLWEIWKSPGDEIIRSCTIITTHPNKLMEPIHHRMPVIIPKDSEDLWLDSRNQDADSIRDLIKPFPGDEMVVYEITNLVNSAANDIPDVLARVNNMNL